MTGLLPALAEASSIYRYTPAAAGLADRIKAEIAAGEAAGRKTVEHFRLAGLALIEAKERLPHGHFLPFLAEEVKIKARTAQAYMRLACELPKLPEKKAQRVAHLSFRDAMVELANTSKKLAALPAPAADKAIVDARDHTLKKVIGSAVAAEKTAARYTSVPGGVVIIGKDAQISPPVIDGEVAPPRRHQLLVAHILHAVRNYVSEIDSELTAEDACEALNLAYCEVQDGGNDVLRPMAKATAEEEELALAVGSLLLRFREVSQKISADDLYEQFPAKLRHNLDIALVEAHRFVTGLHSAWNQQHGGAR